MKSKLLIVVALVALIGAIYWLLISLAVPLGPTLE